jgi:hypothetical protein
MAAIRFGDYIAKINASPAPGSAISRVTGTAIGSEDDALRELVTAFFTANEAEYELRAQLCTNLDQMPIEDASIKWPEELSPHQRLGRLVLPAGQRPNSPERQRMTPQAPDATKERNNQEPNPWTLARCRTRKQAAPAISLQTLAPQPGRQAPGLFLTP